MTFTNTKKLLLDAQRGRYAIGAFNVNNLEFIQAAIVAGEATRSPIIISTSEGAIKYAGIDTLIGMIKTTAPEYKIPIALHLDHGRDLKIIKECIEKGYSSVMVDGSNLPFEENVKLTTKVVALAHKKGVRVEGELGTIGGAEDAIRSRNIIKTDPLLAKEFVKRTGVDFLAVAIGTSHGAYKFKGTSKLDLGLLAEIRHQISVPLVLHGASSVPQMLIRESNKYGANIKEARGVSTGDLKEAIKLGICKVNEDTDLRLAFIAAVRKTLHKNKEVTDPRQVLSPARAAIVKVIEERMKVLGCSGRG